MTTPTYITTPLIPQTYTGVQTHPDPLLILETLTPKDLIYPERFKSCAIAYLQSYATSPKSELQWKSVWDHTLTYLLCTNWTGYALESLIHEFFFNAPTESQVGLFTAIKGFGAPLSAAIPNLDLIKLFWDNKWEEVMNLLAQVTRPNNFERQVDTIIKIELGRANGHFNSLENAKTFLKNILASNELTKLLPLTSLCCDFERFNSTFLGRASLLHCFPVLCNYYFAKHNHPLTHHSLLLYPLVLPSTVTPQINPQKPIEIIIQEVPFSQPPPLTLVNPVPNKVHRPQNPPQIQKDVSIQEIALPKQTLKYPLNFDSFPVISLKKALPTLSCDNLRNVLLELLCDLHGFQNYLDLGFEEVAQDFWITLNSHFLDSSDYKRYYAILRELGSHLTKSPKLFMALFRSLLFRDDINKIKFLFSENVNIKNSLILYWNKQFDLLASKMNSIPIDMRSLEHFDFWLNATIFSDQVRWRTYTQASKRTLIKSYQLKEPLSDELVILIERFCADPEKLGCYTKKDHFKQITTLTPLLASWAYYIQGSKRFEYEPPFNFVVGLEIAGILAKTLNSQSEYQAIVTKISEVFPTQNKGKK